MVSNLSKFPFRGYFDGSYRKASNNAGIGAYIVNESEEVIWECSKGIEAKSNNEAEYAALIELLTAADKLAATPLTVFGDSQLVIYQMRGIYKVKTRILQNLHQRAKQLVGKNKMRFCWIARNENKYADRMSQSGQKSLEHLTGLPGAIAKDLKETEPLDPQKFKEIAALRYIVSDSKSEIYLVDGVNKACTCPGFLSRRYCSHLDAVLASIP